MRAFAEKEKALVGILLCIVLYIACIYHKYWITDFNIVVGQYGTTFNYFMYCQVVNKYASN